MLRNLHIAVLFLTAQLLCLPAGVLAQGAAVSAVQSGHQQVRESLDRMVAAYESKNSIEFFSQVSEQYTGDYANLQTAVQREFSRKTALSVRYTVNNITLDQSGENAFVAVTFTRSWTDVKTAKTKNETKQTSVVLRREDGIYRLYSQKSPYLFGSP